MDLAKPNQSGMPETAPAEAQHLLGRASCALAIFAALMASTTPTPLYPVYISEWGLPQSAATSIFSIYSLGTLASLFLSGWLNGKLPDRRMILLPALLLTALGALLFAMAEGLPLLLAGRLLSGISTGLITGTATTSLLELTPLHRRGNAAVISTMCFTAGAASGPCVATLALSLDIAPLISPFLAIAATGLVAFAGMCCAHWPRSTRITAPARRDASRALSQDDALNAKLLRLACLTIAAGWALGAIMMALSVSFARELFEVRTMAVAGLLPALFQLCAGTAQILAGRLRSLHAVLLGLGAIVLFQLIEALAGLAMLPWLFLLAMPLSGLAYGAAFVGGVALVNESSPPGTHARRISVFYVVGYLVNAAPAFGLGFFIDAAGLRAGFLLATAMIGLVALVGLADALRRRGEMRLG